MLERLEAGEIFEDLDDLSPRAASVLAQVDRIACEDTRRTSRLLARAGIDTPTLACHKFNEGEVVEPILRTLREGRDVALVEPAEQHRVGDEQYDGEPLAHASSPACTARVLQRRSAMAPA